MVHVNKKFKNKTNKGQVLTCPQSLPDTILAGLQGSISLAFHTSDIWLKRLTLSGLEEHRNQKAKSQKSSLVQEFGVEKSSLLRSQPQMV